MKRLWLLLGILCEVGLHGQSATSPVRIGPEGHRLRERDVTEISRQAAAYGKRGWLLDGDSSQVLPETWYIDAYLEADASADTLRRGRVLRLQSRVVKGVAAQWRTRFPVAKYAQVSLGSHPLPASLDDNSVERPFLVDGEFSAEELIGLVTFLRASPEPASKMVHEPDGTIQFEVTMSVEGKWPITNVRRDGAMITAVLRDSTRSGQTVTLTRAGHNWKIVRVVRWVA